MQAIASILVTVSFWGMQWCLVGLWQKRRVTACPGLLCAVSAVEDLTHEKPSWILDEGPIKVVSPGESPREGLGETGWTDLLMYLP